MEGSTSNIRIMIGSTSGGRSGRTSLGFFGGPLKRAFTTSVASSPSNGATPVSAW